MKLLSMAGMSVKDLYNLFDDERRFVKIYSAGWVGRVTVPSKSFLI